MSATLPVLQHVCTASQMAREQGVLIPWAMESSDVEKRNGLMRYNYVLVVPHMGTGSLLPGYTDMILMLFTLIDLRVYPCAGGKHSTSLYRSNLNG